MRRQRLTQGTADLDTAAIEQATGLKGQLIAEENVFKVTKPRTDVKIRSISGACRPSWALAPGPRSRLRMMAQMMMGDTVVFEDEVNPAMSAAFEAGPRGDGAAQPLLLRRAEGLLHAHRRAMATSRRSLRG